MPSAPKRKKQMQSLLTALQTRLRKSDGLGSSMQHLKRQEQNRLTQSVDTEPDCDALGHAQTTSSSLEVADANGVWQNIDVINVEGSPFDSDTCFLAEEP